LFKLTYNKNTGKAAQDFSDTMTLDETQQQEVRRHFAQMQSNTDLLDLLNYVKPLAFAQYNRTRQQTDKPFQLKSLTWYAHKTSSEKQYVTFTIPKKSGKPRSIHAPNKKLKNIQHRTFKYICA
jgi:hypothetical protein